MKTKLILLLLLTVVSLRSFSQSKNSISIQYGTSKNTLSLKPHTVGGSDLDGTSSNLFGLKFTRRLNSTLSLSSGVQLSDDEFILPYTGPDFNRISIKLVSIPVILNVNFLKFLFIDGGCTFDFQANRNRETETQSGIGIELGAGARYNFGPIQLFASPYGQIHAFFENRYKKLLNTGYKFGVGYCF